MSETQRPRILWIHPGGLLPVGGGGAARTWALIGCLRDQGYAVELITGDQGEYNEALEARVDHLWIENRTVHSAARPSLKMRVRESLKTLYKRIDPELRMLHRLSGRVPLLLPVETDLLKRNRRRRLEQFAAAVAYKNPPLAAIVSYAWLAPVLDHMPPGTLRIIDTIDIQYKRQETAAVAGGNLDHITCSREDEARELGRADVLLAIQAEEGATLKAMCPRKEVIVAEHAHPVPEYVPSPEGSREILYIGNRYDPNVLGLRAILDHVWPEVRRACPRATLTVCGRVGEAFRRNVPGVRFAGQVPDLAPYYQRAAVVLNPVPYGTGLKIKTVEGLAQGRCVVCSEAGTGGLDNPGSLPLVVADVRGEMAREILRLLEAPIERHALEKRAWDFARTRFAPVRVYGALLTRLAAQRPR